ncbi:MAG: hypothetical protein Q8P62_00905 [Candidatus Peregrinibacteria bacterium]|nr:hypothetical protein [Candidatus Peregrinibacteria bacterium]
MKFNIVKFSHNKAKKAVVNSSKIEGYKVIRNKNTKIKIHKIAERLFS